MKTYATDQRPILIEKSGVHFHSEFSRSPRAKPASGAPLLRKFGNLSIREILVVTSAYTRTSARTDSGGGGGESQDNPTRVENAIFSWREIELCFRATGVSVWGEIA